MTVLGLGSSGQTSVGVHIECLSGMQWPCSCRNPHAMCSKKLRGAGLLWATHAACSCHRLPQRPGPRRHLHALVLNAYVGHGSIYAATHRQTEASLAKDHLQSYALSSLLGILLRHVCVLSADILTAQHVMMARHHTISGLMQTPA